MLQLVVSVSLHNGVLPQWKPMKVSVNLYCGNLGLISSANKSAGTELLISSKVTAS